MTDAPAPKRTPLPFSRRKLDRRAVDVVRKLQEAGHEAYLVGGCVRDLLVGLQPKDFDVATSARPQQVRRCFRRARIIGRRFRLVHVYSGREVYEVATFRRAPEEEAESDEVEILTDDNVFGTAQEDALRRDFTVNGLFLDPVAGEIVDWVGGLADVEARTMRSIGHPDRRFREDPVRILRLIKFLRRLEFEPGPEEIAAAQELAGLLEHAATARVVEEVFRLMLTGDMVGVFDDVDALGVLPLLLPDLAEWLARDAARPEALKRRLAILDDWVREGGEPSYGLRLAVLYGTYVETELNPETRSLRVREIPQIPATIFRRLQQHARLPRAVLSRASRILQAQPRMDPPAGARRRGKRWDPVRLIETDFFAESLEYLRLRLEADGRDLDLYDEWHERALSLSQEPR